MTSIRDLTRRSMISGLAGCLALQLLPAVSAVSRRKETVAANDVALDLARIFAQPGGAYRIGSAFLKLRPHEADKDVLVQHIFEHDIDARQSFCRWPNVVQRAYIERRCRRDFSAGRTVIVNHWILPETEARLSALAALLRA